jgi:general secretion pathway protein L
VFDEPIVIDPEIDQDRESVFQHLVDELDIGGACCVAGFPAQMLCFRNVAVPFQEVKKIRQILPFEIEPLLVSAAEDLVIDFHPPNSDSTWVLAAAVENRQIAPLLDTMARFQINPKTLGIGSCAHALCLAAHSPGPKDFLFVDVGTKDACLVAVCNRQPCLIRAFVLPASAPVNRAAALSREIRLTLQAAADLLPPDLIFETTVVSGPGLSSEIQSALDQQLKMTLVHSDLAPLRMTPAPDAIPQHWKPEVNDTALSLALLEINGIESFNFRRGRFAESNFWKEHKASLIRSAVLVVILGILALADLIVGIQGKQQQVAALDRQINGIFKSSFPDVKRIVDPVHQMQIQIQKIRANTVVMGSGMPVKAIDVLNAISRRIPRDTNVEITRLVTGPDGIQLSGNTDAFNAVNAMKEQLQASPRFSTVTITSATTDRSGKRVSFKLNVQPSVM